MTLIGRRSTPTANRSPWPTLGALCVGFFMTLVDGTIVAVATPSIVRDIGSDLNDVVWVTSAYLLALAATLLVTGRLGDRYGHRRLYLVGLTVFTLASVWCGVATSVEGLIAGRVVQGLGASLLVPQTMAIITRIFPENRRGRALAVWGATAGVATLVGPIAGGLVVDLAGWQWVFLINAPVGVVGFLLAWRLVPPLETRVNRLDWPGAALSGAGMFLIVFGIQEGHHYDWSTVTGPITVWRIIGAGGLALAGFVAWQHWGRSQPLVPLDLFWDRNFTLANLAVLAMGVTFTALTIPFMLYAQLVHGLTPTQSALLMAPMAAMSIVLARHVGRLTDRVHPRTIVTVGFSATTASLVWLFALMTGGAAGWTFVVPMILLGIGNTCVWEPTAATATRHLPADGAGVGAGVFNTTRQIGAMLGAAGIAVTMDARLMAGDLSRSYTSSVGTRRVSEAARDGFRDAMAESLALPASAALLGLLAAALFARPRYQR